MEEREERAMTEQKDPFEGVRAEVGNGFFCLIKTCKGTSVIEVEMDGDEEFSFEEKFYKEIAQRWNAYPEQVKELIEKQKYIIELENGSSLNSAGVDALAEENEAWNEWYDGLRSDFQGVTDNPHDFSRMHDWDFIDRYRPSPAKPKDYFERKSEKYQVEEKLAIEELQDINDKLEAEITRLKEENADKIATIGQLKTDAENQDVIINDLQSQLSEARESIKELVEHQIDFEKNSPSFDDIAEAATAEANAALYKKENEKLQARIKELETPQSYSVNGEDWENNLWELLRNEAELILCHDDPPHDPLILQVRAAREVPARYALVKCEGANFSHWVFDTLEAAQTALKEGGE